MYSRFAMTRLYGNNGSHHESAARVLFWVPGGMPLMLDVEGAVAAAQIVRGATVSAVICDGAYRACVKRDIRDKRPVSEWGKDCSGKLWACSEKLPYTK